MSLQQWLPAQDAPEVPVNENFEALAHVAVYAKDATTTTGLTWGYLGGRWGGATVTAGTLTLAADSTLYITANRATGAVGVSSSDTAWNDLAAYARAYKVTTGTATVLSAEDWRSGTGGVHGAAASGALLSSLGDVSVDTPADGQVLVYSAALGKWVPGAGSGGGGGGGGRTLLTENRTYYVSPSGSDSANGLSAATAFATLAKAEAMVTGALDLGGFNVTIQLLDGTYSAGVTLRKLTGSGNAILEGNATTPGNVVLNVATGDAVRAEGTGADWQVRNLRVNAAAGSGLDARNGAWLRHSGVVFGACGAAHISLSAARANCVGNYVIAGAAPIHVRQYAGTSYTHNGTSIAVSTPVTFSSAFLYSTGGSCTFKAYTLTGSAVSGKRYTLELLALLDSGGTSASLPGSTAGTTATGAQVA